MVHFHGGKNVITSNKINPCKVQIPKASHESDRNRGIHLGGLPASMGVLRKELYSFHGIQKGHNMTLGKGLKSLQHYYATYCEV